MRYKCFVSLRFDFGNFMKHNTLKVTQMPFPQVWIFDNLLPKINNIQDLTERSNNMLLLNRTRLISSKHPPNPPWNKTSPQPPTDQSYLVWAVIIPKWKMLLNYNQVHHIKLNIHPNESSGTSFTWAPKWQAKSICRTFKDLNVCNCVFTRELEAKKHSNHVNQVMKFYT